MYSALFFVRALMQTYENPTPLWKTVRLLLKKFNMEFSI